MMNVTSLSTGTKSVSTDPRLEVLHKPTHQADNMCLFFALLNAVSDDIAFILCGGKAPNDFDACEAFKQFCINHIMHHANGDFEDGVLDSDVQHYLQYLKDRKQISSYSFYKKKGMCLGHLINPEYTSKGKSNNCRTFIICGTAGASDCTEEVKRFLRNPGKRNSMTYAPLQHFRNEDERQSHRHSTCKLSKKGEMHGIAVIFDGYGQGWIKDAAKNVVKRLNTQSFTESLVDLHMIFEVNVSL
jgi:hypothetical protein